MEYEYVTTPANRLMVFSALYAAGWKASTGIASAIEASKEFKAFPALHLYPDKKEIGGNYSLGGHGPLLDDEGLALLIAGKTPVVEYVKLNKDYTAVIERPIKEVVVGCQRIPFEAVDRLYEAIHS